MLRHTLSLTLLCCLTSASCFADGAVGDYNYNETTGLINIPVARVQPAGGIQVSIGASHLGSGGKPTGIDFDEIFGGNDGTIKFIGGLPGNVEVSAMALHGGVFANNRWVFGAKWLAVPDGEDHPGFAIGVQSLNSGPVNGVSPPPGFGTPSAFGVVSHGFKLNDDGLGLDLHAGIGTGRLRRGFAGGELHFTPNFSIMGETDGTIESAGFRFTVNNRFDFMTVAQFQDPVRFGFLFNYRFGVTDDAEMDGPIVREEDEYAPSGPPAGPTDPGPDDWDEKVPPPPPETTSIPQPLSTAPPIPEPVAAPPKAILPEPTASPQTLTVPERAPTRAANRQVNEGTDDWDEEEKTPMVSDGDDWSETSRSDQTDNW